MMFNSEVWLLALIGGSMAAMAWAYSFGAVPAFAGLAYADKLAPDPALVLEKLRILFLRAAAMAKAIQYKLGFVPLETRVHKPARLVLLLDATPAAATLPSAQAAVPPPVTPGHGLSAQTQIGRLSQIVTSAIVQAANAERLHRAAHEQIDGADYALQNLRNELSSIMPAFAHPQLSPRSTSVPVTKPARDYVSALAA